MPYCVTSTEKLYYEKFGEGEPIVLLHGLGSSGRDWERQIGALADCYSVYTLDFRGHGKSEPSHTGYSIPQFADDLHFFVENVIGEPSRVVGVSMGGMVGFQLAISNPTSIRSLVVVNSLPSLVLDTWQKKLKFYKRVLLLRCCGLETVAKVMAKNLFPKPDQRELQKTFVSRWCENNLHAYRSSLMAMAGWSVEENLGGIEAPVLVIAGDRDYSSPAYKQQYVEKIRTARLLCIADSGHATPIDQPALFNEKLLEFFREDSFMGDSLPHSA